MRAKFFTAILFLIFLLVLTAQYGKAQGPVYFTPTATIAVATPKLDGAIIHVVQPGETLWAISIAYRIPEEEIRLLNNLRADPTLYPGDMLIIRPPFTPTATVPSPTSTRRPSPTPVPLHTATATVTATPLSSPTPLPVAAIPYMAGAGLVTIIIVLALLFAGIVTWLSSHERSR